MSLWCTMMCICMLWEQLHNMESSSHSFHSETLMVTLFRPILQIQMIPWCFFFRYMANLVFFLICVWLPTNLFVMLSTRLNTHSFHVWTGCYGAKSHLNAIINYSDISPSIGAANKSRLRKAERKKCRIQTKGRLIIHFSLGIQLPRSFSTAALSISHLWSNWAPCRRTACVMACVFSKVPPRRQDAHSASSGSSSTATRVNATEDKKCFPAFDVNSRSPRRLLLLPDAVRAVFTFDFNKKKNVFIHHTHTCVWLQSASWWTNVQPLNAPDTTTTKQSILPGTPLYI